MLMSTVERTKEIGVMRAIGSSRRDILILFILEATILGVIGGLIGGFELWWRLSRQHNNPEEGILSLCTIEHRVHIHWDAFWRCYRRSWRFVSCMEGVTDVTIDRAQD
jgi:hypothetical protein